MSVKTDLMAVVYETNHRCTNGEILPKDFVFLWLMNLCLMTWFGCVNRKGFGSGWSGCFVYPPFHKKAIRDAVG